MDRDQAAAGLEQLVGHVQARLPASRVEYARPWRCRELAKLVVRHWPCHALTSLQAAGRNHKGVEHAMALVVAQVHEQWEARHGVGPMWGLVLAGTVRDTCAVVQDLWWSDERWRETLRILARHAGERER